MKIECPVQREGGSKVELYGVDYHFLPQADGAHVAEVTDPDHQDRFLAIGYSIYREGKAKAKLVAAPPAAPPVKVEFMAGKDHPETIDFGNGVVVAQAAVVQAIAEDQGLDARMWNELTDEKRAALLDAKLDAMAAEMTPAPDAVPPETGQSPEAEAAERADLALKFKEKFGRAPHHKLSVAKIREALET